MSKRTFLPAFIYVQREEAGDDESYLNAQEEVSAFATVGATARVGVYKLVGMSDVTAEIVSKTVEEV